MAKYTLEQYQELAKRFNGNSFTGKLILIKQHSLFKLESDGFNFFLRLDDEDAMQAGWDSFFIFPQNLEFKDLRDMFNLIDLKLWENR